jgi:hypothetical protein
MKPFSELAPDILRQARGAVRGAADCTTLEQVAKRAASAIFDPLQQGLSLVRVYVTVPFEKLPEANKKFVSGLAQKKGVVAPLKDSTPVLSLMATRGTRPEWNDRKRSQGHIGIPLISAEFVRELPMVAGLMDSLDVGVVGGDKALRGFTSRATAFAGLFYVPDAATAVDGAGRKLIPAQDFVKQEGIRTVFGAGGLFLSVDSFLAVLAFSREKVEQNVANQLPPLASAFAASTSHLFSRGTIFDA